MLPNEDQNAIAEMARQFAQERLKPFAEQWSREHRYPAEAIAEMAALGFFGMLVPEQWGGSDTGYLAYAMALEEVAAGDGACSTIMSVHNAVGCVPILRFGNDQQKSDFLTPLARGEQIGAFALTEPQAGSDASSLRTRARRDGDHYVLNGAKQFITSGKHAGTVIVFAVTDPDAGKRGISAFIVPTDSPGYQVVRVEDKLGQHASDTCQIAFEDLRVPVANRLGEEGEGYRIALANLEGGRIGIAAQAVGMARGVRSGARLRSRSRDLRQADHRAPGGGLPSGRHGDADRCCTADGASRRRVARGRPASTGGGFDGQAVRLGDGGKGLFRRNPDPGWLRLPVRLPGGAHLPRCAGLPDLRRHQRYSAPGHRAQPRGAGLT